jgi:hypothetical protein
MASQRANPMHRGVVRAPAPQRAVLEPAWPQGHQTSHGGHAVYASLPSHPTYLSPPMSFVLPEHHPSVLVPIYTSDARSLPNQYPTNYVLGTLPDGSAMGFVHTTTSPQHSWAQPVTRPFITHLDFLAMPLSPPLLGAAGPGSHHHDTDHEGSPHSAASIAAVGMLRRPTPRPPHLPEQRHEQMLASVADFISYPTPTSPALLNTGGGPLRYNQHGETRWRVFFGQLPTNIDLDLLFYVIYKATGVALVILRHDNCGNRCAHGYVRCNEHQVRVIQLLNHRLVFDVHGAWHALTDVGAAVMAQYEPRNAMPGGPKHALVAERQVTMLEVRAKAREEKAKRAADTAHASPGGEVGPQ